jgi:hypothetical protein
LVFESLAATSKARTLYIGEVALPPMSTAEASSYHLLLSAPVARADDTSKLTVAHLSKAPKQTLFKEFPDIFGADGIAFLSPTSVLRVQVKMSGHRLTDQTRAVSEKDREVGWIR